MGRKSTTRYENNNATLEEEVKHRKYMIAALKADNSKPYAIVYGFVDNKGRKKLLKHNPVFDNGEQLDRFIRKHKQTVLAVYSRN